MDYPYYLQHPGHHGRREFDKVREMADLIQSVLLELKKFGGDRIKPLHNILLNYSMVFVFSKLIGLTYREALLGEDEKEIALSFVLRYILTKDIKYISDFVTYFEKRRRHGSIWSLFQAPINNEAL